MTTNDPTSPSIEDIEAKIALYLELTEDDAQEGQRLLAHEGPMLGGRKFESQKCDEAVAIMSDLILTDREKHPLVKYMALAYHAYRYDRVQLGDLMWIWDDVNGEWVIFDLTG
jgi:hypothetical protein